MVNLNEIVFKVECGDEKIGTGFLISETLALTAFHVIDEDANLEIRITNGRKKICNARLSKSINEAYKKLDVALLELDQKIPYSDVIEFVDYQILPPNTKWRSRGYPASKNVDGDNINENNKNIVNQQLPELRNNKIDIELEHTGKFRNYEGLSGAPLIVNNKIVGIINTQLKENGESKELTALSIKHFKGLLEDQGIIVKNATIERSNTKPDLAAIVSYNNLQNTDERNLIDKLKDVCPSISKIRVSRYCQILAIGKSEMEHYNEQDISAIKFRVFEACQDELLDFVEEQQSKIMSKNEIKDLLERFVVQARNLIKDRSIDYNYLLKSDDFMRKVVLDLINDCFLSFDEDGLYEA